MGYVIFIDEWLLPTFDDGTRCLQYFKSLFKRDSTVSHNVITFLQMHMTLDVSDKKRMQYSAKRGILLTRYFGSPSQDIEILPQNYFNVNEDYTQVCKRKKFLRVLWSTKVAKTYLHAAGRQSSIPIRKYWRKRCKSFSFYFTNASKIWNHHLK